jgi:epoxide hydrolase-like predicted phosphatase
MIRAVISDFGGVLTTPLQGAFAGFKHQAGIELAQLGVALAAVGEALGANPLFELETGRLTEAEFERRLAEALSRQLGRPVAVDRFGEQFFAHLHPNPPMIELMGSLRRRGLRTGLLTNNVREWEPLWRSMLPVEELFEVVVDSAFVGHRKPEPEIYRLTLERMGVPAGETLFIDDMEINCQAARELGIATVHYRTAEQAIAEIEAAVAQDQAA